MDFPHALETLIGQMPPPRRKPNGNGAGQAAQIKTVFSEAFNYEDENGALLFQVVRFVYQNQDGSFVLTDAGKRKKTFRQRRPDPVHEDQWLYNLDGVRRVLYRLPELLEDLAYDRAIIIAEGERKIDLLRSWNIPATCNSMGAEKWMDEYSAVLTGADIIILPDADEQGRKHLTKVAASLIETGANVRVLDLPGLGPKQDIVDWAKAGGTPEQLHELIAREAKPWRESSPKPQGRAVIKSAASLQYMTFPGLAVVVQDILIEGTTLLAGRPKVGKSWLALDIAIAVATGSACLGGRRCEQGDVLYLALEDKTERRLQRRLTKLMQHETLNGNWPANLEYATEWPAGLSQEQYSQEQHIEEWLKDHPKARLVVIDTIAKFRQPKTAKKDAWQQDYDAIARLTEIGAKHRVAILIITHTNKGGQEVIDEISGTLGLAAAADAWLVIRSSSVGKTLTGSARDAEDVDLAIKFDRNECKWKVLGDPKEVALGETSRKILDALRKAHEPMTPKELAAAVNEPEPGIWHALQRLKEKDLVGKSGRGKYYAPDAKLDL